MKYKHTGGGNSHNKWDVADIERGDKMATIFCHGKGQICDLDLEQPEAQSNIALILAAGDLLNALRLVTREYIYTRAMADGRQISEDDLSAYLNITCVQTAMNALQNAGYNFNEHMRE